jgi:hypothetical protein
MTMPLGCGGSDGSDASTAADLPDDTATDAADDVPAAIDVTPDTGADLAVIDVVTDTGNDPGQPDPGPDTVETYASCAALFFDCVAKCPDDADQACETACLGKAEPADAATMATLGACVSASCADLNGPEDYIECLGNGADRCGDEFDACVPGPDTCKEVRACWLSECETGGWDHECAVACMAVGDAEAKGRFAAFYGCIFELCGAVDPAEWQACYMSKAGNECANHNAFCDQM